MIFTIYSWPNIVLPLLGGIFVDKVGIRPAIMLYSGLVTFGQMFVMIGGYAKNYALILTGRAIFGMGGECLGAAQVTIISMWFRGQELNFALGVSLSLSQFFAVINGWAIPEVYEEGGLGAAFLVGFMICLFSLGIAYWVVRIDEKADQQEQRQILEEDKFIISDIKYFTFAFWLLVIDSLFTYITVYPYIQDITKKLKVKYNFTPKRSALMFGIPYIVAAVLSPILGFISDRVGMRIKFLILSHMVFILAFFISATLPDCEEGDVCNYELAPLLFVGIAYSIFLSFFWGAVPLTVEEKSIGTAYGVCQCFQNIALSFATILSTRILEITRDQFGEGSNYAGLDGFSIGMNFIGLFVAIFLLCWDKHKCEGVLNTPGYYQTEYEEEEEDNSKAENGLNIDN